MNTMKFSLTEVNNIEFATRGQTDNKLWLALQNGRITSSRLEKYCTEDNLQIQEKGHYGLWRKNEMFSIGGKIMSSLLYGEAISFEPTGLHLLPEVLFGGIFKW